MALAFYPRGGSAQVVRYLARTLTDQGHEVQLVSGSLKGSDPTNEAATFFRGLPLIEVDYTEAAQGFEAGLNPMSARFSTPFHPSYEDKPDVPDKAFYKVSRSEMEHLVAHWRIVLSKALEDFQPDVAHLHHLNHLHLAALTLPKLGTVSKLAHLHGTELTMLEQMRARRDNSVGHVDMWDRELRRAADHMQHLVAISPDNAQRAVEVLGMKKGKLSIIPNGVDVHLFRPRGWSIQKRLRYLENLLVTSPRGWDESGVVGSVRYGQASIGGFVDDSGRPRPTLLFVGRFLRFKRLALLLEALVRLNRLLLDEGDQGPPYNTLIIGGVPGEWEDEHPYTIARRLGLKNVFFCGWLPHEQLADAFNLADVFVAPSYFEPFGQVFLEAMASGLPVVATRSGGPLSFVVEAGEKANGWFSGVDDADSLTQVLAEAVLNESERLRRGRNGRELARTDYSWSKVALQFEALYRRLLASDERSG